MRSGQPRGRCFRRASGPARTSFSSSPPVRRVLPGEGSLFGTVGEKETLPVAPVTHSHFHAPGLKRDRLPTAGTFLWVDVVGDSFVAGDSSWTFVAGHWRSPCWWLGSLFVAEFALFEWGRKASWEKVTCTSEQGPPVIQPAPHTPVPRVASFQKQAYLSLVRLL